MAIDDTLQLVRQAYLWGPRIRQGAAAAPARIAGRRAAVVSGPDGVGRFYDPRLQRRAAFPPPIKLVLFGPGTVHGLDDAAHHARKALHVGVLGPQAAAAMAHRAEQEWEATTRRWPREGDVVLFDEAVRVLGATAFGWAGVPESADHALRAGQLAEVLDGFGKPGPAYLRAVVARAKVGAWAHGLIRRTRAGELTPPAGSALHTVACARDRHGRLLPERTAATEFLNLVRPTVAVAWFVTFAGLALSEHPDWRRRIAEGDRPALLAFAQEVRRYYPFTPFLAALTRTRQRVCGVPLGRWAMVVLDVYGTLHDPAYWDEPEEFWPERFLAGDVDPDLMVPQGGGEVATGHRCPGEDVVLAMLAVACSTLARLPHSLPEQDLGYDLTEVLTKPRSGVVLRLD